MIGPIAMALQAESEPFSSENSLASTGQSGNLEPF
jgi:hypothetical protein